MGGIRRCADLNVSAIGEPAQIPAIVRNCTVSGSLPRLQGVEVRLLGLGHPGPGQPVPASRHVAWLQRLWDAVCVASTDRQCLDQQLGDGGARPEPLPSDAAADPAIEFPRIRTQQVPLGWVIELPESLLFETARADLLASADATLDDAVDEIRRLRGRVVRVEGHTDSRGARAYNLRLSERRAAAVAAALDQRGTAVAEVIGHGETRPLVRREYRSDGTPDLRAMARNRRVQLVLAGPEP